MNSFIGDSLQPEVFWAAFAALSTTAAVLVALFQPYISNVRLNKRICNLIESEMKRNYDIVRQMVSDAAVILPGGARIPANQRDDALVPHIKLNLWDEYRYKLASDNPESFKRYQEINRKAEAILNVSSESEPLRSALRRDEARSFVESFEKAFGKS